MQREKKFTKIQQKAFLQQAYPNGHFYAETPTSFCWKYSVQPSSLSGTYQFKICYKEGKHVDVFALDKLSLCEGEKGLPHVYNTDKQHLCIYHRPSEEWNASHKITEIITWISEWF